MNGSKTFSFTAYVSSEATSGTRQTVLIFGTANGNIVRGVLTITSGASSCSWSGTGTLSAVLDGYTCTVTLITEAYDRFCLISGDAIS